MSDDIRTPHSARLVFDSTELSYNFGAEHPLNPARLEALIDLLTTAGLWKADERQTRLPLRPATIE